jgi:hypothetical protein
MGVPPQKRRMVSESIPIEPPTINGLLRTVKSVMTEGRVVERFQYTRGADLVVERALIGEPPEDHPILTPYHVIRNRADVEILEPSGHPVVQACKAAHEIHVQGKELTCIVARSKELVDDWARLRELKLDRIFNIPVFADPDAPVDLIFFCGSSTGHFLGDIDLAIACRTG